MATYADALTYMTIFDNGLKIGAGEADEARALIALKAAQHYFETVAASLPRVLQSTITIATAASTETTTWTSTLLRLDALWYLDPTTLRPVRKIERIDEVGGHVPALPWPLSLSINPGAGAPSGYYANMANFYWLALPDAAYTLRVYGFIEQAELSTRSTTWPYPTRALVPVAQFATRLLRTSTDDETGDLDELAGAIFRPFLKQLRKFDRSAPHGRYYTDVHST